MYTLYGKSKETIDSETLDQLIEDSARYCFDRDDIIIVDSVIQSVETGGIYFEKVFDDNQINHIQRKIDTRLENLQKEEF